MTAPLTIFVQWQNGQLERMPRLLFKGLFTNANSFTLAASLTDLNLGSITLSEAGIERTVGTSTEIGSVDLNDPDITLSAALGYGTSGAYLEMTLSGCWEEAFGADWLTICNLLVSVAVVP